MAANPVSRPEDFNRSIVNNADIRSRSATPALGRLTALWSKTGSLLSNNPADETFAAHTVWFPTMPEVIDLARTANYHVATTPYTPDGLHVYKGTEPLSIPVSFTLHAANRDFCPNGAMSLLQLAARMHMMVLPISDSKKGTFTAGAVNSKNESNLATTSHNAQSVAFNVTGVTVTAPVTCFLDMIFTEDNMPGVTCVGYVREVNTKFKGPWLRGQGAAKNLPSALEVTFTFVHFPNRSNTSFFTEGSFSGAYAHDVHTSLYNTRAISLARPKAQIGLNDPVVTDADALKAAADRAVDEKNAEENAKKKQEAEARNKEKWERILKAGKTDHPMPFRGLP
jgi:hypothetical protein